MISWERPFYEAFYHRLTLAEAGVKNLMVGLEFDHEQTMKNAYLSLQHSPILVVGFRLPIAHRQKNLHTVNGQYFRFLRRVLGMKVAYYSKTEAWNQADRPHRAGGLLNATQHKMLV